MKAIDDG